VIEDPSRFRLGVFTALDTSRPEQVENKMPSPEKEIVRSVLVRAVELGTLQCSHQEIEDYIEGYTYLSRGFAIAHIGEIAKGSKKRDAIIRRFRKFIYRYVNNMLPGEEEGSCLADN
jgi:hypothetical protein